MTVESETGDRGGEGPDAQSTGLTANDEVIRVVLLLSVSSGTSSSSSSSFPASSPSVEQ